MEYLGYILLSLVILLLMVLIHEAGHYTAAKILGFTVDEFSIGFGPRLFGKRRKNGELFSVRALPLGGYCAFMDELGPEEEENEPAADSSVGDPDAIKTEEPNVADGASEPAAATERDPLERAMQPALEQTEQVAVRLDKYGNPAIGFYKQKPLKRIIVLLGGVVFNFLSAIIFSLIYIWSVGYATPVVGYVYPDIDNGGYYNDFEVGDVILAVNGHEITVMDSYADIMSEYGGGDVVTFRVKRGGSVHNVEAARREIKYIVKEKNALGEEVETIKTYTGFGFGSYTGFEGADAGNAFKYCVPYTFKLSWAILGSFGSLITGRTPITSVSGPVGSVKLMADVSIANWRNILILLPLLASNLAIFNILPFPALDGANIVFTTVEWIRKKPLKKNVQAIINAIGLGILLLFVVIVDILSFAL